MVQTAECIEIGEDESTITPTTMGRVASFYYLKHASMASFAQGLKAGMTADEVHPLGSDSSLRQGLESGHDS